MFRLRSSLVNVIQLLPDEWELASNYWWGLYLCAQ